jgi:hypothetical protein
MHTELATVWMRWSLPVALALGAPAANAQEPTPPKTDLPQEVRTLLDQVDANVYSAKAAGLKDLSYAMAHPMMPGPIRVYWKTPNLVKVQFPEELEESVPPEMKKQLAASGGRMAGERLVDLLAGYTVKHEMEGELHKLTATTSDPEKDFLEMVLWIDRTPLVAKRQMKLNRPMQGMSQVEESIKYRKVGDKYLRSEVKSTPDTTATFEYEQVGGYWFPSKMVVTSPMNPMGSMTIEFEEVKVDTGIPASFFESTGEGGSKPEKKTPMPEKPEKKEG